MGWAKSLTVTQLAIRVTSFTLYTSNKKAVLSNDKTASENE